MRSLLPILCAMPLMLCAGCIRDQAAADIGNSAQAIENAAASLPQSPQTAAIRANAAAIGHAVGHDITVNP